MQEKCLALSEGESQSGWSSPLIFSFKEFLKDSHTCDFSGISNKGAFRSKWEKRETGSNWFIFQPQLALSRQVHSVQSHRLLVWSVVSKHLTIFNLNLNLWKKTKGCTCKTDRSQTNCNWVKWHKKTGMQEWHCSQTAHCTFQLRRWLAGLHLRRY